MVLSLVLFLMMMINDVDDRQTVAELNKSAEFRISLGSQFSLIISSSVKSDSCILAVLTVYSYGTDRNFH